MPDCLLQLGCGTAIPSLYLLHNIFNSPYPPKGKTAIHLQDYNDLVFRLVTFPNIILNWCMSFVLSPSKAAVYL